MSNDNSHGNSLEPGSSTRAQLLHNCCTTAAQLRVRSPLVGRLAVAPQLWSEEGDESFVLCITVWTESTPKAVDGVIGGLSIVYLRLLSTGEC